MFWGMLKMDLSKKDYHAPPCPHKNYPKALIEKIGIDYREDTVINVKSQQRRAEGVYESE